MKAKRVVSFILALAMFLLSFGYAEGEAELLLQIQQIEESVGVDVVVESVTEPEPAEETSEPEETVSEPAEETSEPEETISEPMQKPVSEPAEEETPVDEPQAFPFEIVDGVLVAYTGEDQTVQISDGVRVIGEGAFMGNEFIETVVLTDAIEAIEKEAFKDCVNLAVVEGANPEILREIGSHAFANCAKLDASFAAEIEAVDETAFETIASDETVEDLVVEASFEPIVEETPEAEATPEPLEELQIVTLEQLAAEAEATPEPGEEPVFINLPILNSTETAWANPPVFTSGEGTKNGVVTLSWDVDAAAFKYSVFEEQANGTKAWITDSTETTVTFSGASVGDHTYYVRAVDFMDGVLTAGSFSDGITVNIPEAEWNEAPTIVSITGASSGVVKMQIAVGTTALKYSVFEIVDGSRVWKADSSSTSVTLTDVSIGDHTYIVRPCELVDGVLTTGEFSEPATVTVPEPVWSDAPVFTTSSGSPKGIVKLAWACGVEVSKYSIFEEVGLSKVWICDAYSTNVEIPDVEIGDHTYIVRAQMVVDGTIQVGSFSDSVTVNVPAPAWSDPPTVTSIANLEAGVVTLEWEVDVAAPKYSVFEEINGVKTWVADVETTSATLTDVAVGEHTYYVRARNVVDGSVVTGSFSDAAVVTVKALDWNDAPTITNIYSPESGSVTIVWSVDVAAPGYAVYELVDGEYVFVASATETEITITGVADGEHSYAVCAVNEVDGETVEGAYSEAAAVTVKTMAWNDAPIVTSIEGTKSGTVTMSWVAGAGATKYSVFEVVDGKKVWVVDSAETTVTFAGASAGDHSYVVRAQQRVDGVTSVGEFSEAANVTIPASTWDEAPLVLSATGASSGVVKMSWASGELAPKYSVFEYVNGRYVWVADSTTTSIRFQGASVGEHQYAVRPSKTADGVTTTGTFSALATVVIPGPVWGDAPNIGDLTANGSTVRMTWDVGVESPKYSVFEYTEATNKYTWICDSTTTQAIFSGVAAGDHTYVVRSFKVENGSTVTGQFSDPETVTVTGAAWNDAPLIESVAVSRKGEVSLSWVTESSTLKFGIFENLSGYYSWIMDTTDTQATITGLSAGEHILVVRAVNNVDGTLTSGNFSLQVIVNVPELDWTMAPDIIGAEQTGSGEVTITWEPIVAANYYIVSELVDGEYVHAAVIEDGATTAVLTEVSVGEHTYAVQSASKDDEGNWSYGEISETVTVTVEATSPFTTSENEDGTLTITGYDGEIPANLVIPGEIDGKAVTIIGDGAFEDYFEQLESVVISEGIKVVGYRAFAGCDLITSVSLPASVEFLYTELFGNGLATITLAEGNEHYCVVDGVLFTADMKSLEIYPSAREDSEYTVPDGVEYADFGSPHLTSITVPASVADLSISCGLNAVITIYGTETEIGWIDTEDAATVTIRGYRDSTAQAFANENGFIFEALDAEPTNTFTTIENEDGTLTITGFDGEIPAELEIPSEIDDKTVTGIADRAFADRHGLKKITLPDTLNYIGEDVFTNIGVTVYVPVDCYVYEFARDAGWDYIPVGTVESEGFGYEEQEDGTVYITYPMSEPIGTLEIPSEIDGKTVSGIAGDTFWGYNDITSVIIPSSVKVIGWNAFRDCHKLASITLNAGLEEIGGYAFASCESLTEVVIPEGVQYIGDRAFENCYSLTLLDMPGSLVEIGESNIVAGCVRATFKVVEGESVAMYYAWDHGIPYDDGSGYALTIMEAYEVDNRYDVSVGESVTWGSYHVGGNGEYQYQYKLTRFDEEVFTTDWLDQDTYTYEFTGTGDYMMSIRVKSGEEETDFIESNETVYVNNFDDETGYAIIILNETEAKIVGVDHDRISGDITLPDKVSGYNIVGIERGVFHHQNDITSIIIPEGYVYIGSNVFYEMQGLKSITLPQSLEQIHDYAFHYCRDLESINLPGNLNFLGNGAFEYCESLLSISIPASLKSIGSGAFENCWELSDVTIANGVEIIGERAFRSAAVKEITIPASVYDIGGEAFQDCYDLHTVDMSASAVTELHNYVFQYSELRNIALPAGLTTIGEGVFSCCPMEYITLPENLTYLGSNAFEGCELLKEITIPAGVTDIGDSAFECCYNLTDVSFEGDIISIGNRAFNRCHSLKTISIPDSIQTIGEFAFEQCHNLGDLVLPAGSIGFGQHVFMDSNVTLIVEIGSDAYHYARDWEYNYVPVGAAENTGFHYEDEGEGSIIITGYYGSEGFITIPSEIDGKTVTGIGDDAFAWRGEITGVTIPATVNTIGSWAFQGTGLTYVNFEEGSQLYLIGESAFEECGRLTEVILPEGVGEIGDGAFAHCSSLTKLYLPESIEFIDSDLIDGSKKCVLYVVEGSVAETYAKDNNLPYNNGATAHYGVMDVNVYRWTNDVNDYAVWQAAVVEPNEAYELQYQLYRFDEEYGEPSEWTTDLRYTYDFSETMETGDYKLGARMRLVSDPENTVTDFVVGEEIMHISRCDELFRYQIVDGEDGYNAIIYGYDSDEMPETLEIPSTLTVYNGAGEEFTAKVTCIGEDAFSERGGLKNLILPDTIVSIQNRAFYHCWDLESVDLPDNLLYLMDSAFGSCDSLASVTIPGTVTQFGNYIFDNCHGLETVTFEEGITSLGSWMFQNDSNLHTVYLPDTLVSTGDFAFVDCGSLANINLPTGLKTINDYTFAGCWGLKGIEIPDTVETIGQSAFFNTGLYSVVIPDSVTSIGPIAFDSCYELQSVTLSKNLTELQNYTFANCHSLNNVVVPEGITSLGTAVFAENYSLNNITLPDSLTSIGRDCFYKCGNLGEIEISENVTDFGDNIFGEAHNVTIVTTVGAPVGAYAREHEIDYKAYGTASSEQLQIELNGETMQATVVGYGPVEDGQEYIPLEGTLTIPGTVQDGEGNTYTVTAIGNNALEGYGALTGVVIPDSVEVIGEWALANNHHLEMLTLPAGLKRIEVDGFNGCHALTRVDIPDGCQYLGGGAFANCSNLSQIHIPDSVTDFHDDCLLDNSPLAVVYCNPGSAAEAYAIRRNIPYNNGEVNTLAILSTYATQWAGSIGETATWEVIANGDNLQYRYELHCNGELEDEIDWCDSNTYSYEFKKSGIHQLSIGIRNSEDTETETWTDCEDVMFISVNAEDESGWRYVCYTPDEEGNFTIGITGYDGEIEEGVLTIPDTIDGHVVDGILNNVFEERGEIEHVVLNDTIIMIGEYAFRDCGNLQSIDFGESPLYYISQGAFENCHNLRSVVLPSTVGVLDEGAFKNSGLEEITLSADLEFMNSEVFRDCGNLHTVDFSACTVLDDIGYAAFNNCGSLTSVTLPDSVRIIYGEAFQNSGLETVTLGANLDTIGSCAFMDCGNLQSINLQDTALTVMGGSVFENCGNLQSIVMPDTVTEIGHRVFYNCHQLKTAVLSSGMKETQWATFENCHRLESVTLPENLEGIGKWAFKNCHSLSNLTIPATVTTIGECAFENCGMLGDLVIPESVTTLENDIFNGANVTLFVTYDSAAYHYARDWELDYVVSGAEADVNRLNYYYEEDENGNPYLVVNGYDGELEGELNIPAQLPWGDGYLDVGVIDWNAFQNQERLTKVSIPGTVFLICGHAFNGCRNLQEVVLNEGLAEIYEHAFINCERLTKVVVPDGVEYIGHNAFAYCHNLEELHLPESVEKMDESLIEGSKRCVLHVVKGSYAESYAIENGLTYNNGETQPFKVMEVYGLGWTDVVGDESSWGAHVVGGEGALQYHYVLKRGDEEFDLGWSDDPIARYTYTEGGDYRMTLQVKDSTGAVTDFCECEDINIIGWEDEETRLRYNYVGENEIKITSYAGEDNHVVIPQTIGEATVVGIAAHAFQNRDNIESVQLPSTIRFIDSWAFQYCHNLTSINLQDTQITEIGEWAFECVCNIESIILPETLIWLHNGVFGSCTKLQSITIPANVQGIGDSCFEGCEQMTSATFETTKLTEIDGYTFCGCESLTEISIPEGVKLIRENAFRLTGIEKVTLPSTLEEMEWEVFAECCKLTSINLQDTALTTIGERCFEHCCELTSIELPDTVVTVDGYMFLDCHKLETAVLSDGQKYLGWGAFEGCYELRNVTLPANLESIANYAFRFCYSLESLDIPDTVTGIGEYAFEWCGLSELTLGKNITLFEDNVFENCGAVLNVYNDSAALDYAREYGLTYYIIDAVVDPANIQYYFAEGEDGSKQAIVTGYNGDLIGHLEIPATASDDEGNEWPVTVIDSWVFSGCEDLMSVSIPASVMCINDGAFAGSWRMRSVDIAEGSQLEEIWNNAFQDCSMMRSINLENATQLNILGDRVFQNCYALNEITIPASVTEIGEEINDDCPLLLFHVTAGTYGETYCIENGLAYDAGNGFGLNVQWVTVVEEAWNVGDTATWRAYSIGGENVTYQYTLYRAGEKYYQDEEFTESDHFSYQFTENGAYMLGVTAKSVDSEGNITYYPLDEAGEPDRKYADREVIISELHDSGFTYSILENNSDDDGTYEVAITGCNEEMVGGDVTIPATLTIGETEYAVVKITAEAFRDNGSITSLIVPEGVREIEESAFEHMYNMKSCVLPSTVTELPHRIFAGCDQMESVVIPNVETIPYRAFCDCESLQTIELPSNLKGIEGYAFYNCRSLVITSIPDGVEGIDEHAFEGCHSLDRLTIPDSVGGFGEGIFNDTDVTIVANVNSNAAFYAMDQNYNLDAQGTMDPAGFYWNQGSESGTAIITGYDGWPHGHMSIPETVTAEGNTYTVVGIDDYTFSYSEYINELTIPATITYIGEGAFEGCYRLRTLNIEGSKLTTIGVGAFEHCGVLNDFTIPESVTAIKEGAFYSCKALRELTIPASVTEIGEDAFGDCPRLSLKVTAGSAAETYAIANGLAYDNDGAGYKLTMQQVELEERVFELNDTATWLFHAVGGSGELQYQYQLYRNGAAYTDESEWTTETEVSFVLDETGDYQLFVRVQDENAVSTAYLGSEQIVTIKAWDDETGYAYAIVGENSVRIIHPDGERVEAEMTVPAQLAGMPVTQIGADAFSWDYRIETITLPDTIEWIADYAFAGCENLHQINMPTGLKIIGEHAFAETYSLESVTLPEGLTTIGHGAFFCSGITEIAIPASVEEMGNYIFASCEELTTVTLPEGLEEIPIDMFAECYKLTGVTIPSTVKVINNGAFVACGSITEIEIPASVTRIGNQAFRYCVGLQSVTLNEGLQEIGVEGFYMCRSLESIILPSTVSTVRAYAFSGCAKLASVKLSTQMDYLANCLFSDCTSLTSIDLHEGIWSIGTSTFAGCINLGNVTLPATLTSIEDEAFVRCTSMTEIVIPNSVEEIGVAAFADCFALESVTLPDQLTKLNNMTFAGCKKLTSIEIPDGVTVIGDFAFVECAALESIILPSTLESIGLRSFFYTGLSEITIPASVTSIGDEAFALTPEGFTMHVTSDSAALEYAVANGHAYTVDGNLVSGEFLYTFNSANDGVVLMGYMGEETSVAVPETIADLSVVEVGDGAFEDNATMTAIDLPDTVSVIGARAFANCTSLATMT